MFISFANKSAPSVQKGWLFICSFFGHFIHFILTRSTTSPFETDSKHSHYLAKFYTHTSHHTRQISTLFHLSIQKSVHHKIAHNLDAHLIAFKLLFLFTDRSILILQRADFGFYPFLSWLCFKTFFSLFFLLSVYTVRIITSFFFNFWVQLIVHPFAWQWKSFKCTTGVGWRTILTSPPLNSPVQRSRP